MTDAFEPIAIGSKASVMVDGQANAVKVKLMSANIAYRAKTVDSVMIYLMATIVPVGLAMVVNNYEINIDDCNPNPCQNGASCTYGIAAYTRACAPGFIGRNCETNIDECLSLPCKNYGTFVDRIND